ncbi:MAG: sulfatase family protein, partial [Micromonosporaceae bacterium]
MDERPNIVLVMTDQQRAGFTAGDGFGLDTMPFADSLIAQGTRFRRGYTTSPACVPARCSLLTGRFPAANRVRQNSAAEHIYRPGDLLDVLREAGYRTHFAGKPHMYRDETDFDSYAGPYWHERGPRGGTGDQRNQEFENWLADLDHGVSQAATPYPVQTQFPYRIVSDAITAVDGGDPDRPFFTWLSFPEPHNPYQVPEPYFSLFSPDEVPERVGGPESADAKGGTWRWLRTLQEQKRPGYDADWRRYRASYCGMLRLIDDQVRRFVDHLKARGLAKNTVFVFVSDHGDYVGDYGLQRKGAGMPECLMRIPYAVVGPGVVARDNTDDFVSLVDIVPTVCELVGVDIPYGVQGRSLAPLLAGADYPAEEFASMYAEHGFGGLPYGPDERPELHFPYHGRTFDELNSVTQSGTTRMLRRENWKLLYDSTGRGELYDLATDPGELDNRFGDPGLVDVRADLVEELLRWTV